MIDPGIFRRNVGKYIPIGEDTLLPEDSAEGHVSPQIVISHWIDKKKAKNIDEECGKRKNPFQRIWDSALVRPCPDHYGFVWMDGTLPTLDVSKPRAQGSVTFDRLSAHRSLNGR